MKTKLRSFLAVTLVAAASLSLGACNFASVTADTSKAAATTSVVATDAKIAFALIPASVESKFDALAAKYPKALPYVTSIANGFESIASVDSKLPSPATVSADVLPFVSFAPLIPDVGLEITGFAKGAVAIYSLAEPAMANTGAALSEFAELIRSYVASVPKTTATAIAQGGLARAHAAYRVAFAVLQRRRD